MVCRHRSLRESPKGVTLIEVLVSLSIVAILLAILTPAVQTAREVSRNTTCRSHLRQVMMATENYHSDWSSYAGRVGLGGLPTFARLLPYVDARPLYDDLVAWHASPGPMVPASLNRWSGPAVYRCPTSGDCHNFVVNTGAGTGVVDGEWEIRFNGFCCGDGNSNVRSGDLVDGLSQTVAYSEALDGEVLAWDEATEQTLPPRSLKRVSWGVSPMYPRPFSAPQIAGRCLNTQFRPDDSWAGANFGPVYSRELYDHFAPPNSHDCHEVTGDGAYTTFTKAATSEHSGHVNVAFADGHVRAVVDVIDLAVWHALGTRDGHERVGF